MTQFSPNVSTLANTAFQHTVPIGSNAPNESVATIAVSSAASSLLSGSVHSVSPETMMVYLNSRLTCLDGQIQEVFDREQKGQHVREEVHAIQSILASAKVDGDGPKATGKLSGDAVSEIQNHLDEIEHYDVNLANELRAKLSAEGQVLHDVSLPPLPVETTGSAQDSRASGGNVELDKDAPLPDVSFTKSQLDASKDYLNGVSKDLDAASQLDMISLQQSMSARQTAIQLATNLIAALNESAKAIATNIR